MPTKGTLNGTVRYKGANVGGAIVNVGGNSLLSKADGTFKVELPSGAYQVQAGKLISGGSEGSASATITAGADSATIIDLQDPPELYRRLIIRGTMKIEDYENFGSNEHATRHMARNSEWPLRDARRGALDREMGGEIRVEVTLKIDWKIDLSIHIDWNVKFFEGTSEETSDLDGERSGSFMVGKDQTRELKFSVWNTDEDEPQDRADISFDLTNGVRP